MENFELKNIIEQSVKKVIKEESKNFLPSSFTSKYQMLAQNANIIGQLEAELPNIQEHKLFFRNIIQFLNNVHFMIVEMKEKSNMENDVHSYSDSNEESLDLE